MPKQTGPDSRRAPGARVFLVIGLSAGLSLVVAPILSLDRPCGVPIHCLAVIHGESPPHPGRCATPGRS